MAIIKMEDVPDNTDLYSDGIGGFGRYKAEAPSSSGPSLPVVIPSQRPHVGFMLDVETGSGSGYVQATVSTRDKIEADTAIWETFPEGTVSTNKGGATEKITGIRCVQVTGTVNLEVTA